MAEPDARAENMHATAVAVDGAGVLLRGPSGAGKSDLALRLIDTGALLVADDRILLQVRDGRLTAEAPPAIAGKLEVRGVGILHVPHCAVVPVHLAIDLVSADDVDRHPDPSFVTLLGVRIQHLKMDPFQASAPAQIRLALKHFSRATA